MLLTSICVLNVINQYEFAVVAFCDVSMGGAIAVHVATRQKLAALAALVVIDVVEGLTQLLV